MAKLGDDIASHMTFRLRRSTTDALARQAKRQDVSMKFIVCQALATTGVYIAPADLADKTPKRAPLRRSA